MSLKDALLTFPLVEHVKVEAHLGLDLGRQLVSVPYQHALQTLQRARQNVRELQRYKLVSFDLFDTLLRRRIEPPDYLKRSVARYLCRLVAAQGKRPVIAADVQARRDWIEHSLRGRSVEEGLDTECRHEELMSLLLADLLRRPPTDAELQQVLDFELQMEIRALSPNSAPCALLAEAKAAGLRVIVTSDMYLSSAQLQALLDAHGVARPDKLYASADLLLNKGSGRLFRHILQAEGVAPHEMVHIGDNQGSDVLVPRRLGITALCYYEGREKLRRLLSARTLERVQRGQRPSSTLPLQLATAFAPRTPAQPSPAYELGQRVLGPAYCVFLHRVMLRAEELQLDQLHFLAREGFLLKQIYEVLQDHMHPLRRPTLHYTYLSRLSTSLPVLARLGIHQSPLNRCLEHGLADVLRSYDLYDEQARSTLRALGVSDPEARMGFVDPRLQAVLRSPQMQELVASRARPAHALLRRYLEQLGFFSCQRAALVDIGWSGTIQNNIIRAFSSEPDFPELFGFYLALTRMHPALCQGLPMWSQKEGLLYDYRTDSSHLRDRAPFWFEEIFELPAQAPHGTTLGYAQRGADVEPVLQAEGDAGHSARASAAVAEIQRGILDYARDYGRYAELADVSIEQQVEEVKKEIARFIFHPSERSLTAVRELVHSVDWGTDTRLSPLGQVPGDGSVLSWLRQRGRASIPFDEVMWKHGEVRHLGGPLAAALFHLYTWFQHE